jgi:hypothetical protein
MVLAFFISAACALSAVGARRRQDEGRYRDASETSCVFSLPLKLDRTSNVA